MCNSLKGLLHLNLVSWKGSFFRLLAKSLFLISEFGLAENVLGAAGWILLKAKSDFLITCPLSNVTVCFVSDRGLPPSGLKYGSPPLLLTVLLNQLPPWLKVGLNGIFYLLCPQGRSRTLFPPLLCFPDSHLQTLRQPPSLGLCPLIGLTCPYLN